MASPSSRPSQTQGDGHTSPVPFLTSPRVLRRLGPEPTVLVIGYPAPAAVRIVERLLATDARTVACVVSRERWADAEQMHRGAQEAGRLRLFEGAAALPGLGLPHTAWRILDTTDEIYGVASAREIAVGHIQDFADECPLLRELHLVPLDASGRSTPPSKQGALRRIAGLFSGLTRARTSFSSLASAFALGGAVVASVARAVGPWRELLDFDIETALSWEDIERDLAPGLRPAV
ncbi:hypothetical protein [Rubricoccus marinus]|uniref:Uncharacterized protein n=1 Tax=Rubricoccus marinus TaxID=716817 RepID=A0A259U319_9BACT|nr:hypothetical protein [Rubricoccus marinus]OZC04381.1 hypothetical protein BSZ36_16170 [Rubricoccus marinus]